MPDHFHALIHIRKGRHLGLGDIIGGFQTAVSRELHRKGGINPALHSWHRNYYEMIVRSPEAEEKIPEYIRMTPWHCVQDFGNRLRGMGQSGAMESSNAWNLLQPHCPETQTDSEGCRLSQRLPLPMEKEIFNKLLEHRRNIIWCPA